MRLKVTTLGALLVGALVLTPGRRAAAQETVSGVVLQLEDALARGDVEALLDQASERIGITLFEANRYYSRGQARYVLKTFFEEHPPRRFVLRNYYKTRGGWFAEGDFWYERGERPLRVYLRLRWWRDRWELRELLIEKQPRE
jgi:hypothetical protein